MAALRTPSLALFGIPPLFSFLRAGVPARAVAPRGRVRADAPCGSAPTPRATARVPVTIDAPGIDIGKVLARAASAPELAPIEWDGDLALPAARAEPESVPIERASLAETGDPAGAEMEDPRGYDARRRRIRDRYIGARFPGVARGGADLEHADRVIHAARLYFEDGQGHTALELLELAIAQAPREPALRLARLEILFLERDAAGYAQAARDFIAAHPEDDAWHEVARLGRTLAPGDGLFGEAAGPRDHEHYGPWPHLPNWIRASWDLTAEVTAAEFHAAMARRAR
jgi:hypothetical protein